MKPKIVLISSDNKSQGIYNDAINLCRALIKCGFNVVLVLDQFSHCKDFGSSTTSVYELKAPAPYSIDVELWPTLLDKDVLLASILNGAFSVIQIESLNLSVAKVVADRGLKYYLLVNLEWCVFPKTTDSACLKAVDEWIRLVRQYEVICLARSLSIYRRLCSFGVKSLFISWSVPGPIIPSHLLLKSDDLAQKPSFFFSGGNNGWMQRRGADTVVNALHHLVDTRTLSAKIIFKCNKSSDLDSLDLTRHPEITPISGFLPRSELISFYKSCTFFLYPSRFEGLGLSLLEACQYGLIPIYTSGYPMHDVVGGGGIPIKAKMSSMVRLAESYDVDMADLSRSISDICEMDQDSLIAYVYEKKRLLCSHMWDSRRIFFNSLCLLEN